MVLFVHCVDWSEFVRGQKKKRKEKAKKLERELAELMLATTYIYM